ncbi:amidohydrolase family protein [Flavobacterium sp. NST-5]|uniref:Amidohydrolase family protein n=1 Tax=Flavobacterium ichthyis TaxID=2698827 RepID=A0ABW9Z756_9FLAO|nr:amidohydrolase family protein [Flavobacterium ichthyis]NBL64531.1 amidohydrolase family protein [Flavobacterium ichthyis]
MKQFYLLLLFLSFAGFSQFHAIEKGQSENNYDLVILNAKILNTKSGKVSSKKSILISKGKIVMISSKKKHQARTIIDAKGKLVTPSFIDPHIHPTDVFGDYEKAPKILPVDSLNILRKKLSDEYLPYGTTTVMTMGQPENWVKELVVWQNNSSPNNVDFIVCGGALISKDTRTPYIGHTEVTSSEMASQKIVEYSQLGIKHIKLYHRLKEPEFSSIIKVADSLGIKTYGHIGDFNPEYLTIPQTLEKGLKNYEHLALIPNSVITTDDDWVRLDNQFKTNFGELNTESRVIEFFLEQFRFIKENKHKEMKAFIKNLRQNNATFSTTLHRLFVQFEPTFFTQVKDTSLTEKQRKRCQENFNLMMQYVKKMHDSGIEIRLGSDMPNGGKVNLSELIILSKYGFKTADIFKIASYNGAKAIGIENETGSLEIGKKAHLIIWSKNPFDNAHNFVSEKTIIKDGEIVP